MQTCRAGLGWTGRASPGAERDNRGNYTQLAALTCVCAHTEVRSHSSRHTTSCNVFNGKGTRRVELDGFCLRTAAFCQQDRILRDGMFVKSITGGDKRQAAVGVVRTLLLGGLCFRRRNGAVPPGLPGLSRSSLVSPGCPCPPRAVPVPPGPPDPQRAVARPGGAPWWAAPVPALARASLPVPSSKSLPTYRLSSLSYPLHAGDLVGIISF